MYATGSRQEIEALTRHLIDNHRVIMAAVENDAAKETVLDLVGTGQLFTNMLLDAIHDHFAGKN